MPSWQGRLLTATVRAFIRRRRWGDASGDAYALARRARRVFGAPSLFQWLRTRGVRLDPVRANGVRGEWVVPTRARAGAILYVHGGGFVSCSAATHRPITAALAKLSGRRVFALEYRLAPEHRFPAALDDAVACYRWLLAQNVAPASVALAGDSAGGGLVLATLLRVRDEGLSLPACAVCFSPWADLAGTGDSFAANDGRCAMFHRENIGEFAAAYLGDASPLAPYASPVFGELDRLPPLLIQVESTELLLDDALRVHRRVLEAGGRSRVDVFEALFHGWQLLDAILPEARVALRQAATFIRDHLDRGDQERCD